MIIASMKVKKQTIKNILSLDFFLLMGFNAMGLLAQSKTIASNEHYISLDGN